MANHTNIQEVEFKDALGDRYLAYALSTIMSRSLPDLRDGLKPVHRRVLFAMLQLKLDPKSGFKKCARIVGDVIGKYHPHGEVAVYDTLVRMAQNFSSRYPTIEGQGNFGSVDGDNQAAMRYTEAKLTEYALLILKDIDKDTVDFRPNYDGNDDEPVVLPSAVPNILANGTEGIAVGMATSIPPHNLAELCDACVHLVKHPNAAAESLLKYVKGPDFPTGGVLVEPIESIKKSYSTGRGSFRLRAQWNVEELERNQYRIIITEIPYQVQKRGLIEKMADLFNDKKLPFLDTFQDMSAEDIRIILVPKTRNIKPEAIMESLFKLTDLEVKVQLNMNVLNAKSVPSVMSLQQILLEFLEHRRIILTRKYNNRLGQINDRLEILAGLLIAYLNLDEIIRIIREEDEPKDLMMEKFKLTDRQAEAILNTRLRSLRKLEEMQINTEDANLKKEKKEITAILKDPEKLDEVLAEELKQIKADFSKNNGKRKTIIADLPDVEAPDLEAFIEKEPITISFSSMGWLKATKGHNLAQIKYKEGDSEGYVIQALSTDKLIFFTDHGKAYSINCDRIAKGKGDGDPIRLLFEFLPEENVITAFLYNPEQKYLLAANDGRGFIVTGGDLLAQTKAGKVVMISDKGDVRFCAPLIGNTVAILGENRRLLLFPVAEIPVMKRGKGVTLQKYKQGFMKDLRLFNIEEGLSWASTSMKDAHIWQAKRGSMGRIVLGKLWVDKK
ncbi:MAG: DNA topoisomerase IV subunit A [Rickettsiales bacterium]